MEGEDNVWEDRKGASQVLSVFYFFTWEIRSRNKMFIGYKKKKKKKEYRFQGDSG